MNINWLDIVIATVLGFTGYWGWQGGMTEEVFRFLCGMCALFFGFRLTHTVADVLAQWLNVPIFFLRIVSFLLVVLAVMAIFWVLRQAIDRLVETVPGFDSVDRFGGMFVGLLKGSLVIFIVLLTCGSLPMEGLRREIGKNTLLASRFMLAMPKVYAYITERWHGRRIASFRSHLESIANRVEENSVFINRSGSRKKERRVRL